MTLYSAGLIVPFNEYRAFRIDVLEDKNLDSLKKT